MCVLFPKPNSSMCLLRGCRHGGGGVPGHDGDGVGGRERCQADGATAGSARSHPEGRAKVSGGEWAHTGGFGLVHLKIGPRFEGKGKHCEKNRGVQKYRCLISSHCYKHRSRMCSHSVLLTAAPCLQTGISWCLAAICRCVWKMCTAPSEVKVVTPQVSCKWPV